MTGNFVVRKVSRQFNLIPIDQGTEWINKLCKITNGIIGITRNDTARDRFCVTWDEISIRSNAIKDLHGLDNDEDESISTDKGALPPGEQNDEADVVHLVEQFTRFKIFSKK